MGYTETSHHAVTHSKEVREALSQGPGFLELSHSVIVSDGGLLFNLDYHAVLPSVCSPTKWREHLCWHPLSVFRYMVWSMAWQLWLPVL